MPLPRISRVFGAINAGSFRISAMIMGLSETGELIVLGSGHRGSQDAAGTALALLAALPQESGAWGTGRVLRGTLVSAILTDDGRIAVGAVDSEVLGAALASQ